MSTGSNASSTRRHREDRGLGAVARVRGVRETDSRIGLQHQLAAAAAADARVDGLEEHLAGGLLPALTMPGSLMGREQALVAITLLLGEARDTAADAAVLSAEARGRWSADRARLAAVEHLLERRVAARRADAARREAREADDIAAQRWARAGGGAR